MIIKPKSKTYHNTIWTPICYFCDKENITKPFIIQHCSNGRVKSFIKGTNRRAPFTLFRNICVCSNCSKTIFCYNKKMYDKLITLPKSHQYDDYYHIATPNAEYYFHPKDFKKYFGLEFKG